MFVNVKSPPVVSSIDKVAESTFVTVILAPAVDAAVSISVLIWLIVAIGKPPYTSASAVIGWTSKLTPLAVIANLPGALGKDCG